MNTRTWNRMAAVAILSTGLLARVANAATNLVTNISGDPNIFECDLTATNLDVTLVTTNGATLLTNTVHAMVYKDENAPGWPVGAGIPVGVMNLKPGQNVICRFKNRLTNNVEGASIHWHGIEMDNDSDGTSVTQDSVLEGQSYTYRFSAPRPGLFWFHSHMVPGNTTFAGMYGVIVITNNIEGSLIASNVVPATADTYLLALSDIEFATNNAYAPAFPQGSVGREAMGKFQTMNQWTEDCYQNPGSNAVCTIATKPGTVVLVNGEHPLEKPGAESPMFTVPANKKIRLRLLNEALSRHFQLRLVAASGSQINLFRIGGQGGLLNKARLEGGLQGTLDTKYISGELLLGSGDRVDVVAYTTGTNGAILRLLGSPVPNSLPSVSGATFGGLPNIPNNYPIAYFKISGTAADPAPTTNDVILAGTAEQVVQLGSPTGTLLDPAALFLGKGTNDPVIHLTGPPAPSIDDIQPVKFDGNLGNGDFLTVRRTNSTRYAYVGDLLELSVTNATTPVHPFHLHGFSFQPVRLATTNGVFNFDYYEFRDTMDVYGAQILTFRVRLQDRPKTCDLSPDFPANPGPVLVGCVDGPCGGALGRWLYHCHMFPHAGIGMIGELVALAPPNQWAFFGGKWETPSNWSLGLAPASCQGGIFITNPLSKTVTIDAVTTNTPSTLTISNLTVKAPSGSINTLFLNNAGTMSPLRVGFVSLGDRGAIVVNNSAILATNQIVYVGGTAAALTITNGGVVFSDYGIVGFGISESNNVVVVSGTGSIWSILNQLRIGQSGRGNQLIATDGSRLDDTDAVVGLINSSSNNSVRVESNATWRNYGDLLVGDNSNSNSLVIAGGSVTCSNATIGASSLGYQITNNVIRVDSGSLFVTNALGTGALVVSRATGKASLIINGGSVTADLLVATNGLNSVVNLNGGALFLRGAVVSNSQPFLIGAAGQTASLNVLSGTNTFANFFSVGPVANATGIVWITGGQLTTTNTDTYIGSNGIGQVTISNGTWRTAALTCGYNPGSRGALTIAGGTNVVSSFIMFVGFFTGTTGDVWLTDGLLLATNTSINVGGVGVGQMTISNGTCLAGGGIFVGTTGGPATLRIAGGTSIVGQLVAGSSAGQTGALWLTGGQLTSTNFETHIGRNGIGQMTVSNGNWQARNVMVGRNAGSAGSLTIAGGANLISLGLTLGTIDCTATGTLNVVGGSLFVTNAAGNALLDVESGTFAISGGFVQVDQIILTNSCAHFGHTGGTLIYNNAVLLATRDDDGDGIPNGYEQSHGLDPLNPSDANIDSDGDGLSNLQEFLAGTDATNSASAFRITAIARVATTNILVTWTMGSGKTNALQRTAGASGSFATNNFAAIFTVTNTVGTTTNYLDVGAATNMPALYYRVRLVP